MSQYIITLLLANSKTDQQGVNTRARTNARHKKVEYLSKCIMGLLRDGTDTAHSGYFVTDAMLLSWQHNSNSWGWVSRYHTCTNSHPHSIKQVNSGRHRQHSTSAKLRWYRESQKYKNPPNEVNKERKSEVTGACVDTAIVKEAILAVHA